MAKKKESVKDESQNSLQKAENALKTLILQFDKLENSIDIDELDISTLQRESKIIVNNLVELDKTSKKLDNNFIPIELIDAVEQRGANPDLVVKDWLKATIDSNQKAKGRSMVFEDISTKLATHLKESFPAEFAAYENAKS